MSTGKSTEQNIPGQITTPPPPNYGMGSQQPESPRNSDDENQYAEESDGLTTWGMISCFCTNVVCLALGGPCSSCFPVQEKTEVGANDIYVYKYFLAHIQT